MTDGPYAQDDFEFEDVPQRHREITALCEHRYVEEYSSVLQMFVRRCQRCWQSTTLPSADELLDGDTQ